jgi:cobalamin-dependent methionine synthase I
MMAVTIGDPIETTITNHFGAGNYTAGLLLDAAATAAVESIADQVNHLIDSLAAKKGYATTWRFSPGYGDWNITIQQKILAALHAGTIGLTATESFMLQPRKSITAAIGLRSKNCCQNSLPQTTSCVTCAQKTCLARKEI